MAIHDELPQGEAGALGIGRMAHLAGAALSLALIAGLAVWGYRLAVRDTTGVPVVRAMEGPMRVAPENPGGTVTAHQGLAVNAVAAEGTAAAPADTIVLAPRPIDLAEEDRAGTAAAPAAPVSARAVGSAGLLAAPGDAAATPEAVAAVEAEAIARAVAEATATAAADDGAPGSAAAPAAAPAGAAPAAARLPAGAFAPAVRPEPRPRPAAAAAAAAPVPAAAAAPLPVAVREVDPASLPPGTRLVQLGAFDSVAAAHAEWDRLVRRFGDLLAAKGRVVTEARSSGQVFYRLRAEGFADEAEARRFCSALLSEQAACIPVTQR
jgi:hypothetical protein